MAFIQGIETAEQLLRAGNIGRCELVRGELEMMSPLGAEHGVVVAAITEIVRRFVKRHRLGVVMGAETGFQIEHDPDTVRGPDVGFVAKRRLPRKRRKGFFDGPPDLAIEVRSPDDRERAVTDKITLWLRSECRAVWLVDPHRRTVAIHRSGRVPATFGAKARISGGDVLPGFEVAVSKFFEDLDILDAD
jgi:Uma2 family endonuclease